jgi:hypothetical protein
MSGDLRRHRLREGCYRIVFLSWPRSCKTAATRASKNSQTVGFICAGVWLPVLYSQTRDRGPRAVNETLSNMRLRRFAAKLVQCFTHEGKAVFIGDEKIFKNVPRRTYKRVAKHTTGGRRSKRVWSRERNRRSRLRRQPSHESTACTRLWEICAQHRLRHAVTRRFLTLNS